MSTGYGSLHFECEVSWRTRGLNKPAGTDIRETRNYSILWPYNGLEDIGLAIDETLTFAKKKIASMLRKGDSYHAEDVRVDFNMSYLPVSGSTQPKFSLWLFPGRTPREGYDNLEPVRFAYASNSWDNKQTFNPHNKKEWKAYLLAECQKEYDNHSDDLKNYQDWKNK